MDLNSGWSLSELYTLIDPPTLFYLSCFLDGDPDCMLGRNIQV
jgi:hypothetical protein